MEGQETNFIEAEQLGGQEGNISFREIVLRHLSRITQLASKEFIGGYWNETPISIGGVVAYSKHYVEDSREAYSNAVNNLFDLLLPLADKKLLAFEEKNSQELEEAYKKSCYKTDRGEEGFDKQQYQNDKVKLKRTLFQEVSKFLNRIKYLEGKKVEG